MAASREEIMQALFTLLSTSSTFKTKGRRVLDPENVGGGDRPAFFLIEGPETYSRPSSNLPSKNYMNAWALIYTAVDDGDENAIPAADVNNALDALDAALKPDNMMTGQQTLGGLVQSCIIEGDVLRGSGDVGGKTVTAVPIRILRV